MEVAIFSDLHLGLKQDSVVWHEIALKWCDEFVKELKKRNIKDIIFLGDFFHHRNTISVNTLHVANDFLNKLSKFNLHMILGNHDLYYANNPTISGVNLFKNKDNIIVYDKPTKVKFGDKDVVFCGWGYDPLEFNADILFTHAEINVFKFNKLLDACESDLKCSDLLKNYNLVYSGHFHMRQEKQWANNKSIIYVGNPYSMDFSDEDIDKGFNILNVDTLKSQFIKNTISPSYKRFKLSELITNDLKDIKEIVNGNIFKLIIDKNITITDLTTLSHLLTGLNPFEILVEWENGFDFRQNGLEEEYKVIDFCDIRNIICEYISLLDLKDKEKLEIKDYILNIYDKVAQ